MNILNCVLNFQRFLCVSSFRIVMDVNESMPLEGPSIKEVQSNIAENKLRLQDSIISMKDGCIKLLEREKNENKSLKLEVAASKLKVDQVERDSRAELERVRKASSIEVEKLKEESDLKIRELSEKLATSSSRVDELKEDLDISRFEEASAKKGIEDLESKLRKVKDDLEEMYDRVDMIDDECVKKQQIIDSEGYAPSILVRRYNNVDMIRNKDNRAFTEIDIIEMESQLEAANRGLDYYQEQVSFMEAELSYMEQGSKRVGVLKESLKEVKRDRDTLRHDYSMLVEKSRLQEEHIVRQNNFLSDLNQEVDNLKFELGNKTEEVRVLGTDKESELESLVGMNKEGLATIETLKGNVEEKDKIITKLEADNLAMAEDLKEKLIYIRAVEEKSKEDYYKFESTSTVADLKLIDLESEVKRLKRANENLLETSKMLRRQLDNEKQPSQYGDALSAKVRLTKILNSKVDKECKLPGNVVEVCNKVIERVQTSHGLIIEKFLIDYNASRLIGLSAIKKDLKKDRECAAGCGKKLKVKEWITRFMECFITSTDGEYINSGPICLACPESSQLLLVDLSSGKSKPVRES